MPETFGGDEQGFTMFTKQDAPSVPPKDTFRISGTPNRTIRLIRDDGKEAIIDFSGDAVTFRGELPVDEAAKLFFQAVGGYLKGTK